MPTVVDSLIITLGLDPTDFTKGSKAAAQAYLNTKTEAVSAGKAIEDASKKAADSINLITVRALEMFSVFVGARGLTDFITSITRADAALGRLAVNLGISPQVLGGWENAASRLGGTADATASTMERLAKTLYDFRYNASGLPQEFSQLEAISKVHIDPNHGLDAYIDSVADALKRVHDVNPTRANFLAQGLGIDDGTAQVMYKYGAQSANYIKGLNGLSPSNATIKATQDLITSWTTLQQTVIAFGNSLVGDLEPKLKPVIEDMTKWVVANESWIKQGVLKAVQDFVNYLKGVDWKAVGTGLQNFASDADKVANSLGGIKTVIEGLIALWAGGKVVGIIKDLSGLALLGVGTGAATGAASAGAGAAATGGGISGALGAAAGSTVATILAGAAAFWLASTTSAGTGEGDVFRGAISRYSINSSGSPDDRNVKVNGATVSRSNPLPVSIVAPTAAPSWWDNMTSAVGGFLGGVGNAISHGQPGQLSHPTASAPNSSGGPDDRSAASAGSTGRGWWTPENQAWAYQRLTKEGLLTDSGARALISRWMNVESPNGPGSVNRSSGAFGIAQLLGPRLKAFQAKYGNSTDKDQQMDFILQELGSEGANGAAGFKLREAKSNLEGATGASMYERAEGYNSSTGTDDFTLRTMMGMTSINTKAAVTAAKAAVLTGSRVAAMSMVTTHNLATNNNRSTEINIDKINIPVGNGDPMRIARHLHGALKMRARAAQNNSGLA